MYFTILKAFNFAIYREKDYFISKKDDKHFKLTARNGIIASIAVIDKVMFVDLAIYNNTPLARYSTPLLTTTLSVDDFVIKNMKETPFFKMPIKDFEEYMEHKKDLFTDVYKQHILHDYMIRDIVDSDYFHEFKDGCFYKYTKLGDVCYNHVFFSKKKIIKNVFKYSFTAQAASTLAVHLKSYIYLIGDVFFEVCNLEKFMRATLDCEWAKFSYDVNDMKYGIDNQLFEHNSSYKDVIEFNKILLLKRSHNNYCTITKKNRKITLSYFKDFNINTSVLDEEPGYSSERAEFKGDEHPVKRYTYARMVTHTYSKGQTTTSHHKFSKSDLAAHQMAVSNLVFSKLDILTLKYPAIRLLHRLTSLGLSAEVPLNPDDLCVLDMYVI